MKTEAKCLPSSLYNGQPARIAAYRQSSESMEGCRLFILNLSGTSPQLVRYLLGTELLSNLSLQSVLYKFHFMIGGKEMAGKFHRRVL